MSCSTPVTTLRHRRRTPRIPSCTMSPCSRKEEPSHEEEEEIFLSQVPSAEDGVYWAFDNPELDAELHKKMTALDEASPTCRKKQRSTPKFRLKLAGSLRRNNNGSHDEEAKQFLSQCFGDFINKKENDKTEEILSSGSITHVNETKGSETSNIFDEDEEEFLLLASQAVDSSLVKMKSPISLRKDFNRRKSVDPFEDDSFDTMLSQLPDDAFNKPSPKPTKLSLKRHGTAEDLETPKSAKKNNRSSSFRRNNSAPVIESPSETIPCTQEEIMRKKEAALKKRLLKQNKHVLIQPDMKQEIEMKRREAIRRRNLLQRNAYDK